MRGDWKDQYLNEQHQRNMMRQAEQERLIQAAPKGRNVYIRILNIQLWLDSLFHPRRFAIYASEPVLKTQNLRAVK